MAVKGITRERAEEFVSLINDLLASGEYHVGRSPSAAKEAARQMGWNPGSASSFLQSIATHHGLEPDWSLDRDDGPDYASDDDSPLKPGEKLSEGRRVPLSEDERKFHEEWTAEDCLKHLREIAEENPDRRVTRNFFRVHSDISEATWNRYFGTFAEFKKQAGIVLSRHAQRLEKSIAKHASVDVLRQMNVDKLDYGAKYEKPSKTRWKDILVFSDVHDKDCDPFYRRLSIEAARRLQPDAICINGDLFDLPEFSKYTQDPREWDPVGRIRWVHEWLAELREASPESQFDLIEGNHEYRLLRHLAEATKALRQILHELHGFSIQTLLGLDDYEVNYISKSDLCAFTESDIKNEVRRNYQIYYDALLAHHYPDGRKMGYPGWNGHHHKHVVTPFYSPAFGSTEWHQIGSGSRRVSDFCDGKIWANGFLIAHCDSRTKHTAFEYVEVKDFAVIGGVWYERQKSERL